jgi:hypothetical protein
MNRRQIVVLWAGLIVVQLMVILPPVGRRDVAVETVDGAVVDSTENGWTLTYGLITRDYASIRFGVLAIQLVLVAAVTGGLIYVLRDK